MKQSRVLLLGGVGALVGAGLMTALGFAGSWNGSALRAAETGVPAGFSLSPPLVGAISLGAVGALALVAAFVASAHEGPSALDVTGSESGER